MRLDEVVVVSGDDGGGGASARTKSFGLPTVRFGYKERIAQDDARSGVPTDGEILSDERRSC